MDRVTTIDLPYNFGVNRNAALAKPLIMTKSGRERLGLLRVKPMTCRNTPTMLSKTFVPRRQRILARAIPLARKSAPALSGLPQPNIDAAIPARATIKHASRRHTRYAAPSYVVCATWSGALLAAAGT